MLTDTVRVDSQFRAVDRKIELLQREIQLMAARMCEMETVLGHRDSNRTANPQVPSAYTPAAASASGTGTTSSSAGAALGRILNPPKSPTYIGPTSAEFGLTARRNSVSDGEESSPSPSEAILTTGDPLTELGLAESLRLLLVYEQSVGIMYPCVDLDSVRTYIVDFFRGGGNAPAVANATDQDWFFARDASVIKMIFATALLVESHGRSERAAQLADFVEDEFATRVKIADVDMKELLILALLVSCVGVAGGKYNIADAKRTLVVHFSFISRRRSHRMAPDWPGGSRVHAARTTPSGDLAANRRCLPRRATMQLG